MKKADFKFETLAKNIKGGEKEARMVPYTTGDKLHFVLSESLFVPRSEVIQGETREWTDIATTDGEAISATQITRRKNGLPIEGKTVAERLQSFCNLFNEDGTLTLTIDDIVERNFKQKNGDVSTSRYFKFVVA